jgi:hypothetical protein
MNRRSLKLAMLAGALAIAGGHAGAWHYDGHRKIVPPALTLLDGRLPEFFLKGGDLIAHCSGDPDAFKDLSEGALRDAEYPEHFLDWELLKDNLLPATRSEFQFLCNKLRQSPRKVGLLPYAVCEWEQRLEVALAEHRRWPDNPNIRTKALVYAGILAHYAGDLCHPLHLTIDYDGRVKADGISPRSGIHMKTDALLGKSGFSGEEILKGLKPEVWTSMMVSVIEEIKKTRPLVDRIYELEAKFPPSNEPLGDDPAVKAFVLDRMRRSAEFLASCYLTAWEHSATTKMPDWYKRAE